MVKVTLRTYSNNTPESIAAAQLKESFEKELGQSTAKGKILIASSVQIYGQAVKDLDLVVLGSLKDYSLTTNTKYKNKWGIICGPDEKSVEIHNFVIPIELKDHDPSLISCDNSCVYVEYRSGRKNVTQQSENQKYSLKGFMEDNLSGGGKKTKVPFITNLIWLRQMNDSTQITELENKNVIFGDNITLSKLLSTAIRSTSALLSLLQDDGTCKWDAGAFKFNRMEELFSLFDKEKKSMGMITRDKVARITTSTIDKELKGMNDPQGLLLLKGVAGTGKTAKLLRIAYKLHEEENARCIILTYNQALVGDIHRLLAFSGVADTIDSRTISVSTLHSFFYGIIQEFGPEIDFSFSSWSKFDEEYTKGFDLLYDYVLKVGTKPSTKDTGPFSKLDWDYVLVDEAQDWTDKEKDLLLRLYNHDQIIVADGVDQIVRGSQAQDWLLGMKKDSFTEEKSYVSLRQKKNLVMFDNLLSKRLGGNWEVKPNPEGMGGGNVYVTNHPLDKVTLERYANSCKAAGNDYYDIVLFAPTSQVEKDKNGYNHLKIRKDIEDWGFSLFDGTNYNERNKYARLDQIRAYSYDSCRGLEGWTVICLDFDVFVQNKFEGYEKFGLDTPNPMVMNSFEDRRKSFIRRWIMMAVTRPIDTLVITLKDQNSQIANILRECSFNMSDFVDCNFTD